MFKKFGQKNHWGYRKFGYEKCWVKNDHPVPCHWINLYNVATDYPISCKFWSHWFFFTIDHPVSYDYGSPCVLLPWITLYSLTNDHPVSSDNGQPSIGGCQVSQVSQIRQFTYFKHIQVGGWVEGLDR